MIFRSEGRSVVSVQHAQLMYRSSPGTSSAHKLDIDASGIELDGRVAIAEEIHAAFLFPLSFSTKLSPCLTAISES